MASNTSMIFFLLNLIQKIDGKQNHNPFTDSNSNNSKNESDSSSFEGVYVYGGGNSKGKDEKSDNWLRKDLVSNKRYGGEDDPKKGGVWVGIKSPENKKIKSSERENNNAVRYVTVDEEIYEDHLLVREENNDELIESDIIDEEIIDED